MRRAPATLRYLLRAGDRQALPLFLAGLAGVAAYSWRLWLRERALAERLRREAPPTPALPHTPTVSALVAAWNEGPGIEDHLRSFLGLHYPDIELILCAGGTDDTYKRALAYAGPRVTVLRQQPGEGKQRALARCLEQARGELIYLTDADCLYDDKALEHLLAPLVNDGALAATGTSRPLDAQMELLLPRHLWAADAVSDAHRPELCDGVLGRNAALTREAISRIGGLNFPAPTGTDYQLAKRLLRASVPIRFVRESVVATSYPETFGSYRRKQSRWLRNLLMYGPAFEAHQDVTATWRTIGVGVGMALMPFVGLLFAPVLLLWLLLLAHGSLARLRHVCFCARRYGITVPPRLIAALPALTLLDLVTWALPLLDLLQARRRSQW